MEQITKFYIGTGLLYVIAQIILGLLFCLVFRWRLVDTLIIFIVNGVIFLVIWITMLKITIDNNKENKK